MSAEELEAPSSTSAAETPETVAARFFASIDEGEGGARPSPLAVGLAVVAIAAAAVVLHRIGFLALLGSKLQVRPGRGGGGLARAF
jgi:hypothetical protein